MVANTTIAAIAKHGIMNRAGVNVYHVTTGFVNPLRFNEMFEYIYEHFNANPLVETGNVSEMKLFDQFCNLSEYLREQNSVVGAEAKVRKQNKARVAYAEQLCKMYEFLGFFKARYRININTSSFRHYLSRVFSFCLVHQYLSNLLF